MPKQAPGVDLDAILAANTRAKPGGKCMVGHALGKLDDATRTKLVAAMADTDRFAADGLAAVFTALGHEMSRSPIERHRRGGCQCPR